MYCPPAEYGYLVLLKDGTIQFVTRGETGGSEGILVRK